MTCLEHVDPDWEDRSGASKQRNHICKYIGQRKHRTGIESDIKKIMSTNMPGFHANEACTDLCLDFMPLIDVHITKKCVVYLNCGNLVTCRFIFPFPPGTSLIHTAKQPPHFTPTWFCYKNDSFLFRKELQIVAQTVTRFCPSTSMFLYGFVLQYLLS